MSADLNLWILIVTAIGVIVSNVFKGVEARGKRKEGAKNDVEKATQLKDRVDALDIEVDKINAEIASLRKLEIALGQTLTTLEILMKSVDRLSNQVEIINKDIKEILKGSK